MGISHTRMKGKAKLRGKPQDLAKAEILVGKHKESVEARRQRRTLFKFLDIIIILSFILAIYSVYSRDYRNAVWFLVIGMLPLLYFIVRRILKDKKKQTRKKR